MWPEVSVVLCTWNRAALLEGALAALLEQPAAPPYEVIVVDNASTDATAKTIAAYARRDPRVRYVHERQQGLSFARNAGARAALGAILAFTDDDVRPEPDWVRQIADGFQRHPDAAWLGGPVLPQWAAQVPRWLTREHWAPLGVQDYGGTVQRSDPGHPICLIGANLSIRRKALECAGRFDAAVQRVGNGFGSTEDQEWQERAWAHGLHGVYDPSVRVHAIVTPQRLTKAHHRTWHFGHGRHVARMRLPNMEASRWRPFGVPLHLVRQALQHGWRWLRTAPRDRAHAFAHEAHLCFVAGFLRERLG